MTHFCLLALLPVWAFAQTVIINEIAWMGTKASTSDEWIELYNTTPDTIDLSGYLLVASDNTPKIFLTGALPPHDYFVLERTDDQTISNRPADKIYTGDLKNSGEWLQLRNGAGLLIDEVRCDSSGWFAGTNSPKRSMERRHPLLPGSHASSWSTNDSLVCNGLDADGLPIFGTPGSVNSVFDHTLPVNLNLRPAPSGAANEPSGLTAYPNPFNPGTMVEWHAPPGEGVVEIFDVLGRVIRIWPVQLDEGARSHRLFWDGCDAAGRPVATGVYLCRLRRGSRIDARLRLTRCR